MACLADVEGLFSLVLEWTPRDEFLFVAGVCKRWKQAWLDIGRSPCTNVASAVETPVRTTWVLGEPAFTAAALKMGGVFVFGMAAHAGNLKGLQMLAAEYSSRWHSLPRRRGMAVTVAAARGGHVKVLQWAQENGCAWDVRACNAAAAAGHLETLQWLRQHDCPWGSSTCASAAGEGKLEVLQWAWREGCPWDATVCISAAAGGHLKVLKWARQRGCPWHARVCTVASKRRHTEVLHWARAHGCPWSGQ